MMDNLEKNIDLKVLFHNADDKGNCLADIVLPHSGTPVNDLKVMPGLGGGIMVHMPAWMHTRWSYSEIQWVDVRKTVAERYRKEILPKTLCESGPLANFKPSANLDTKKVCKTPSFVFHSKTLMTELPVEIVSQSERIKGIRVLLQNGNTPIIIAPPTLNQQSSAIYTNWNDIKLKIYNTLKDTDKEKASECGSEINFGEPKAVASYLVDVTLPHKRSVLKGFRLNASDTIRISTPKWMGRWNDSVYTWQSLCSIMKEEFKRFSGWSSETASAEDEFPQTLNLKQFSAQKQVVAHEEAAVIADDATLNMPNSIPSEKGIAKEKNEYGRIKNAYNSPIRFFPQTVLRSTDNPAEKKRNMLDLVSALSKGSAGGIGQFEINIVDWVDRLRYVTSTMLLDLIRGGFVSIGWREKITQDKLADVVKRMAQYDLVTLTRFVTVDDNGEENGVGSAVMRILTLGRAGNSLLHELGKNTARYNPFNVYQDGNTVKRYLAANQWLVYLLTTYSKQIGEAYETNTVLYRKGSEFSGARIFASVTCNEITMVGEPIRRVEAFEEERNLTWLRHKYERFNNLFSHLDELYNEQEEFSFVSRPVLVYICEDDEHMREVYDMLADLINTNPDQEVWFTTDLRIFNYDYSGERFVRFNAEGMHIVNIEECIEK